MPGTSVTVNINVHARECAALLEPNLSPEKDRFLIACVVVDDAFVQAVAEKRESSPKEMQSLFAALWEKTDKDSFHNKRLNCRFIFPTTAASSSASTTVSSSAATTTAANNNNNNGNGNPNNGTDANTSTAASPLPASGGVGVGAMSTPAQDATKRASATPSTSSSSVPGANASDATSSDKKYKELYQLLVQAAEERDRFAANFKEANRELMSLREQARGVGSSAGGSSSSSSGISASRTALGRGRGLVDGAAVAEGYQVSYTFC